MASPSQSYTFTTNEEGQYQADLPPARYQVEIHAAGYQNDRNYFRLTRQNTASMTIVAWPEGICHFWGDTNRGELPLEFGASPDTK